MRCSCCWRLLQQHASVPQGRIYSDICTCCHTEIEVTGQTFYLTKSQYTDTGPTGPCTDPITPGAWHCSHCNASFEATGMTRPGKIPTARAGIELRIFRSRGGRTDYKAKEAVWLHETSREGRLSSSACMIVLPAVLSHRPACITSLCLSVSLCLSGGLPAFLCICLTVCLSLPLSLSLSLSVSVCLSVCLSVSLSLLFLSLPPSPPPPPPPPPPTLSRNTQLTRPAYVT